MARGMRGAFGKRYTQNLVEMGVLQGRSSPCCFYHPTWDLHVVVHGDDFTALGTSQPLDLYEQALSKRFDLKLRGRLGEAPEPPKEIRVLDRILRVTPKGLRWEADPRHSELLMRSLALTAENTRFTGVPGIRLAEDLDDGPAVNEPEDLINPDNLFDPEALALEEIDIPHAVFSVLGPREPKEHLRETVANGVVRRRWVHLRVADQPEVHEVQHHSELSSVHPRSFVLTGPLFSTEPSILSEHTDPYTGKLSNIMHRRHQRKSLCAHPTTDLQYSSVLCLMGRNGSRPLPRGSRCSAPRSRRTRSPRSSAWEHSGSDTLSVCNPPGPPLTLMRLPHTVLWRPRRSTSPWTGQTWLLRHKNCAETFVRLQCCHTSSCND